MAIIYCSVQIVMLRISLEGIGVRLSEKVEDYMLESAFGGRDNRPFESSIYLDSDMSLCL